jgi:hypothetical protein
MHPTLACVVLFLFHDEYVHVEKVLQLFVGVIDAELLERVDVEYFEACSSDNHKTFL